MVTKLCLIASAVFVFAGLSKASIQELEASIQELETSSPHETRSVAHAVDVVKQMQILVRQLCSICSKAIPQSKGPILPSTTERDVHLDLCGVSLSATKSNAPCASVMNDKKAAQPNKPGCLVLLINPQKLIERRCQEEKQRCQEDLPLILDLIEKSKTLLKKEPIILKIETLGKVMLIGDLHGSAESAKKLCEIATKNIELEEMHVIFLGDYVDRGEYSIDVLIELMQLKQKFPDRVFLLRGNHEFEYMNSCELFKFCFNCFNCFKHECSRRFGDQKGETVYNAFNEMFNQLPLAAIINKKTLCVHGGPPARRFYDNNLFEAIAPDIATAWNSLLQGKVDKKTLFTEQKERFKRLVEELTWNDPCDPKDGYENTVRRVGSYFGLSAIEKSGFDLVIRAHEYDKNGFKESLKDDHGLVKCVTIFSALNYASQMQRAAYGIYDSSEGKVTPYFFSKD